MKVNTIQNTNFSARPKPRFITKDLQTDLKNLLEKMNDETKYTENQAHTTFTSDMVLLLKTKDGSSLFDKRFLLRPAKKDYISEMADCSVKLGSTKLEINSATGKIIQYKKPFYKPWYVVINKLCNLITTLKEEYNKPDIVEKHTLKIAGFTQRGVDIIEGVKKNINN